MAYTTFQTTVTWTGESVCSIAKIRGKQIIIDEPKMFGGTDQGPTPVELLLASLGGCISVLVTSFAGLHDVEIRGLDVHVEGDLNPEGFLEKNPNIRPGFETIRYAISIDSPSHPDQIRELLAHVERVCPVKDTLRGVSVTQTNRQYQM
ncbi:OsmC family protein [Sulfoacidibacillus thermotolerans]|uniref:Peroxiredoxin n=1 Tax=Sulfoacidibacillus thermotolerans TaxID=1765684 RepID=A0A2U3DBN8_SULT2|nr:OsmC family protein [Sulfoacidibacillus thermotolerans]PWI58672.1 peroxiredoxin [Sulfoacidibacillus thermotolerans]